MQTSFYNYGQTYTSAQHNDAKYAVLSPGPYRGFALSVAGDDIVIGPGYGVLHNGYIWKEDGNNLIDFSAHNLGPAATFTICAVHVDRMILGGAAVTYEIRAGILTSIPDGVILGWVRYPGAVALVTAHLQKIANLLLSDFSADLVAAAPETRYAPINDNNGCYTQVGYHPDITLIPLAFDAGNFVVYQSVKNSDTAAGAHTLVQHMQFFARPRPPYSFDFYLAMDTEPNTSLTVQVYDTALNPVAPASVITGTGGLWAQRTVTLDFNNVMAATFTAGEPYTLRLTYSVGIIPGPPPDAGKKILLSRVSANFWPF